MTLAYITEYNELAEDTLGRKMAEGKGNGTNQTPVDFTSGEAKSAAFGADIHIIRLHVDAACHILFGEAPTADTNDAKLAANQTEFFHVTPGEKISVISA